MKDKKEILLVSGWDNSLDGLIGKIEFFDSPRASFAYELLKAKPGTRHIVFSFEITADGSERLIAASLQLKRGKNHPVTKWRRINDKIITTRRKLRKK